MGEMRHWQAHPDDLLEQDPRTTLCSPLQRLCFDLLTGPRIYEAITKPGSGSGCPGDKVMIYFQPFYTMLAIPYRLFNFYFSTVVSLSRPASHNITACKNDSRCLGLIGSPDADVRRMPEQNGWRNWEIGRLGDWEIGKLRNREVEKLRWLGWFPNNKSSLASCRSLLS